MTWLVIGEEYLELSAREYPSVTPLPDSRVESGWVVSVGADTSQAVTADTTLHRSVVSVAEPTASVPRVMGCVGCSTQRAGVSVADTTDNSPPGFSWFAGGATEPRVADYPSLPGVRRFPFRVG